MSEKSGGFRAHGNVNTSEERKILQVPEPNSPPTAPHLFLQDELLVLKQGSLKKFTSGFLKSFLFCPEHNSLISAARDVLNMVRIKAWP